MLYNDNDPFSISALDNFLASLQFLFSNNYAQQKDQVNLM